jgi:hypothetical protein
VKNETRIIGSLEGFFISGDNILKHGQIPCCRNQMQKIEEKYKGKFIPFEI